MQSESLAKSLLATDLFSNLSVSEGDRLGQYMRRVHVEPGQYIIRQGMISDDLYVIESGEAEIHVVDGPGSTRKVHEVGPGDYFGEIGLLTGGERTADVIASTSMSLLRLSKDAYFKYLGQMVDVQQKLAAKAIRVSKDSSRAAGQPVKVDYKPLDLVLRKLVCRMHGKLFAIAEENVSIVLYGWLGMYKILIIVFCICPYAALLIMGA